MNYRPAGFRLLPEVVKNLLIINFIMYFASILLLKQGLDLNDIFGLHYFMSEKFRIYQPITYMFMHDTSGIAHVLFNMFGVWMFGSAVENIWGGKRFLIYYILTGLGAAVAHYAIVYFQIQPITALFDDYLSAPDYNKLVGLISSDAFKTFSSREVIEHVQSFLSEFNSTYNVNPSAALENSVTYVSQLKADVLNAPVVVGASGAVFGLLLAYGMMFPNSLVYVYFALPIKAKYFVILYGAAELFSGIAQVPGDNVAHFAHLGGLVTGLLIIWYQKNRNNRRRGNMFG
jgi:membrane associated rhomboid family serine protease